MIGTKKFFYYTKIEYDTNMVPTNKNINFKNGTIEFTGSHKLGIPEQKLVKIKNRRTQITLIKKY